MDGYRLITLLFLVFYHLGYSQFQLNGTAFNSGEQCFSFETTETLAAGSVWNINEINLNDSLEVDLQFYLGCPEDEGSRGFLFVLQTIGTFVGNYVEGNGYGGIAPSLAIELDINQDMDQGDPTFDHLAIVSNGVVNHNAEEHLAGPVQIINGQNSIQDCQYHSLRVVWVPQSTQLDVYVDCERRLSKTLDPIALFGEYLAMYWGFTSGNRDESTIEICLEGTLELDELDDIVLCVDGKTRLRAPLDNVTYLWQPPEGLSNPLVPDPLAFPEETTTYTLLMQDDCGRRYIEEVTIEVVETTADFDLGPPDTTVCDENALILDATFPDASYEWEDGSTNVRRTITNPGNYSITVTTPECQTADEIEVVFAGVPNLDWPADTLACLEEGLILSAEAPGASYQWQDGAMGPTFEISTPGMYQVMVTNSCGATTTSIEVDLMECRNYYIPNAFSPNDDGINDRFFVQGGTGNQILKFQVYDRWGGLIFDKRNVVPNDQSVGWDGKARASAMLAGTYLYYIEFQLIDGSTRIETGTINLLR